MKTPLTFPGQFKHITNGNIFEIEDDFIYKIKDGHVTYVGLIYKYTRKGFYYIDLFQNKSYITWSNFDDVNKKDDDNLPNQLPLFPDTEQV